MGIEGLFQICDTSRTVTLSSLAQKYVRNDIHLGLRLGIDAFAMLAIASRQNTDAETAPAQVALGRLFDHLLNLLHLGILPLFVFDGPSRPTMKRKRRVYVGSFHIERPFREMIAAFGFSGWSAPGEAEAELAMLCKNGFVDVVMTNDSDSILYETPRIVRPHVFRRYAHDHRELDTDANEPHPFYDQTLQSRYSQQVLVLYALLAGGDYSTSLPYTGKRHIAQDIDSPQRAFFMRIARDSFTDGTSIAHALVDPIKQMQTQEEISAHAQLWRVRFADHVALEIYAVNLPDGLPSDFPDIDALRLYAQPLVSDPDVVMHRFPQWTIQSDLSAMAKLAADLLAWDEATFAKRVAPGLAVHTVRKLALKHQRSAFSPRKGAHSDCELVKELSRARDRVWLEVTVPELDKNVTLWCTEILADAALRVTH